MLTNPSWDTIIAWAIDFNSFIIMPLVGGYMAPETRAQFKKDERVYDDAGVTEDYLFRQSSNMFKEHFWKFFGMFSRLNGSDDA